MLTNNNAELFHRHYRSNLSPGIHPSMPAAIEALQSQMNITRNDISDIYQGKIKQEKRATRIRTGVLRNLILAHDEQKDDMALIRGVANLYLSQ